MEALPSSRNAAAWRKFIDYSHSTSHHCRPAVQVTWQGCCSYSGNPCEVWQQIPPNQITQPEDIDFLRDIASRHPDPALSAEIAWFEVRWHDDGGRGFTAIRQDGTAVEWNFYPVFTQQHLSLPNAIYAQAPSSRPCTSIHVKVARCRASQADVWQPYLVSGRDRQHDSCQPGTGLMQGTAHVEAPGFYVRRLRAMCGSLQRVRDKAA